MISDYVQTTLSTCRDRLLMTLYAGLLLGAIPAAAEPDWTEIEALKSGQMKGLAIHEEPRPLPETPFLDPQGFETSRNTFEGKVTVLNFWATWCGPCRKEMPTLDALQVALGGDSFAVQLIASGPRNEPEKIEAFFEMASIDNLTSYRDPNADFSRDMSILGLPITVVLDPLGNEIARLRGDADWNSPEAQALLSAIIEGYADGET